MASDRGTRHDDVGSALLARVPLFDGLEPAAIGDIAAAARRREIPAGHILFAEGDEATAFFVVQSGSVKLTQLTPAGHIVVLRLIGPGAPLGGVATFSGGTYPITAEAVTAVLLSEWQGPQMAALMEKHPRLAINALKFVASQLHDLQVRYRQLATEKVEQRVARALLRLVRHAGRKVENGVLIDLPLSREDVAQMTGTTLYTVSRILSHWESEGVLEAGRQRVIIRNPHALIAAADELA
jgi:CRP-like cAMP-binding protein